MFAMSKPFLTTPLAALSFLPSAADSTAEKPEPVPAVPVAVFLSSIGVCTTFPDRGQPIDKTVEMIRYCGFRWVRGGIEGLTDDGPTTLETFLTLHRETGVKFNWGLVSGGTDIARLLETGRVLADMGALFAFEGNNEPNNWGVTYGGAKGGGHGNENWVPVACVQRDLYAAVKADPLLREFPVWSISEAGGQLQNTGLQYLVIPEGAGTAMPDGTRYADALNVHNYIYHPAAPAVEDNKTWDAASPGSDCRIDGLYGNHGVTWARRYPGIAPEALERTPRVTTETGTTIGGEVTEEIHGLNLLSLYLAQFRRGWRFTSVYLLRDRTDEGGNQTFGFFAPDYTPRKAAHYLHNLTTILEDSATKDPPRTLSYAVEGRTPTVHDLLLAHSDGTFRLIVWGESVRDAHPVTVRLARPCSTVCIFNPVVGTEPVATLASTAAIPLTMRNHPFILEIRE